MKMCKLHLWITLLFLTTGLCTLGGCQNHTEASSLSSEVNTEGTRNPAPQVLIPKSGTSQIAENEYSRIDTSNSSEGYFLVLYKGTSEKVKLRVTAPDKVIYTYNLKSGSAEAAFPFSSGSGTYEILVCENTSGDNYAAVSDASIKVTLTNDFKPFLYPNQYVRFDRSSKAVKKAEELSKGASQDLDVIRSIYYFITDTISYDDKKAASVSYDYLPDVDETLSTGKGICFDYAAIMTAMLRSQRIPTKLQVGFSGEIKHAWISTYVKEHGWIDNIIEFDGKEWKLMDPTFASSADNSEKILDYIGDGKNYVVKYNY